MTNGARGLLAGQQKVKNPIVTKLIGEPNALAPFWQEPSTAPPLQRQTSEEALPDLP